MKYLLNLLIFVLLSLPATLYGQTGVFDGVPFDSTIIRFNGGTIAGYHPDTAASPLWQIGRTHKAFFTTDTAGAVAIMTDTLNYYPVNANNWFVIPVPNTWNVIVDFWHKYQTTSGHDGGVVEFSLDSGASWKNVVGECSRVLTANCYASTDTLASGEPAFTGVKDSLQYSRVQFFTGFPEKTTSGASCSFFSGILLRFRFVSDSVADTLAGWMIDSVKIETDSWCCGGINTAYQQELNIKPNPSNTGLFTFPAMIDEEQYTISIYNAIGQRVLAQPYKQSLDLSHYVNGMYFYSATNGTVTYTGRLLKE